MSGERRALTFWRPRGSARALDAIDSDSEILALVREIDQCWITVQLPTEGSEEQAEEQTVVVRTIYVEDVKADQDGILTKLLQINASYQLTHARLKSQMGALQVPPKDLLQLSARNLYHLDGGHQNGSLGDNDSVSDSSSEESEPCT